MSFIGDFYMLQEGEVMKCTKSVITSPNKLVYNYEFLPLPIHNSQMIN